MKTKITSKSLKWIQAMVMTACLSLLFSAQLFAQHHGPFHGNWNDSAFQWGGHTWNDSILGFHRDSLHFPPPPPPHDSIHIGNDTIIVNGDTIILNGGGHHFPPPPPPPPHDSIIHLGGDTIVIGNDTIVFPPPPPPPPHDSIIHLGGDTIVIGNDTIILPPPPPHDSTGCGGHRLADPNSPAQAVIISIYPNPVMESAVLHIENTSGTVTFRMYEMNGRLAMEKTFTNGDFSLSKGNLGAGLYFYEINDGNTNISKGKLIFQ